MWPARFNNLLFLILFISPSLPAAEKFSRSQLLMGNISVSITIETSSHQRMSALKAMEEAFSEAKRVESRVSEWRPESQTSLLNRNAGKAWIPIGHDLMTILLRAQEISEATEGAFDISFASSDREASYKDIQIQPALMLARLDRTPMKIGVSGIAKGYIVDRMSEVLEKRGFKRFIVDAGDLFYRGKWTTGIKNPDAPEGPPVCRFTVKDQAVSTSGLYERGPHILDPKTKRPIHTLKSITVVAQKTIDSDAWATALFVLGPQKGLEVPKNYPQFSALLIDQKNHRTGVQRSAMTDRCQHPNQ